VGFLGRSLRPHFDFFITFSWSYQPETRNNRRRRKKGGCSQGGSTKSKLNSMPLLLTFLLLLTSMAWPRDSRFRNRYYASPKGCPEPAEWVMTTDGSAQLSFRARSGIQYY
jgi:hypothetical protein